MVAGNKRKDICDSPAGGMGVVLRMHTFSVSLTSLLVAVWGCELAWG